MMVIGLMKKKNKHWFIAVNNLYQVFLEAYVVNYRIRQTILIKYYIEARNDLFVDH